MKSPSAPPSGCTDGVVRNGTAWQHQENPPGCAGGIEAPSQPSAHPTSQWSPSLSVAVLGSPFFQEDPLVLHLCHQMVTAHGHSHSEPHCDAEAGDVGLSLSLMNQGMLSLLSASSFTHKGPWNWCPLMESSRKPSQEQKGRESSACPCSPCSQQPWFAKGRTHGTFPSLCPHICHPGKKVFCGSWHSVLNSCLKQQEAAPEMDAQHLVQI